MFEKKLFLARFFMWLFILTTAGFAILYGNSRQDCKSCEFYTNIEKHDNDLLRSKVDRYEVVLRSLGLLKKEDN